jgi:hypothetical protein
VILDFEIESLAISIDASIVEGAMIGQLGVGRHERTKVETLGGWRYVQQVVHVILDVLDGGPCLDDERSLARMWIVDVFDIYSQVDVRYFVFVSCAGSHDYGSRVVEWVWCGVLEVVIAVLVLLVQFG